MPALSTDADTDDLAEGTTAPAERLPERPQADTVNRAVARNRIANALFQTDKQVEVGRYRLLERVGIGGMGVVWGAWDPELERRVALKLVQISHDSSRERVLAEGQTLAKLSHPNVVPIYDVGVVDNRVYLVMEWVRGTNLRVAARQPRTVAEIVGWFRAAGEGLLAAHQAGLIHRDFKPENVMLGEDGRVRVLDFGLALETAEADDDRLRGAGTPKYMPPEQANGGQITPAVDQYAFCVALRELIAGRRADGKDAPVPAWLAAICDRGAAQAAFDRFPSMADLLRALARDPATVWRRRLAVAGAVGVAGVAFVVGSARGSDAPEPCVGSPAELSRAWNPAVRDKLIAHAQQLGPYGAAEATNLASSLGAYGERWVASHRGACLAHARGELTPQLYERGLACLMRSRAALATVVDVLARAPVDKFPDAVKAARDLPNAERCIADATESSVAPPERSIAGVVDALDAEATRAAYLALAADPQALAVAKPLAAAADQLGYQPLIARAQLALGAAHVVVDEEHHAVPAYGKSAAAALAAFDDVMFVEAFARELWAAGRFPREELPADARDLAATVPFVEVVARRAGNAGQFARALFFNNVGTTRMSAGDAAGARAWFGKARDELRAGAPGAELFVALGNLAMVAETPAEREKLFAEERALLERTLGPQHAFTLQARMRAAAFIDHAGQAAGALNDVCTALAIWYPHQTDKIARCNYELGWLADERGDRETARRAYTIAAAGKIEETERAQAWLAPAPDPLATAIAERAQQRETWFARFPAAVDAWLVAADARVALGKPEAAIAALRAAGAVLADSRISRTPRYYRRKARVEAMLAQLLAKRDPKLARELARSSLEWSRAAGGYDARVRALEPIAR